MKVLRVATFNIRHGRGLDDRVDLQRTAAAILETDADVIALQELDRHQERSGGEDQVARLEALTGLHIDFWPSVSRGDGEYGIGIGTRGPVDPSEWRIEPLPRVGSEEPRGAIFGLLKEHGLSVVSTHLSTNKVARRAQILTLAEMAASLEPPVVILGDLNQGRVGLRPLIKAGYDAGRRIEHTMTRRSLRWQIDFVLVGPPARLASTETITTEASDHVPLVAEVAIPIDP